MNDNIKIKETSINTRRRAKTIAENAIENGYDAVDLSNVEFVSRSVADEFVHQAEEKDLEIVGQEGDVEKMFNVVLGRSAVAA